MVKPVYALYGRPADFVSDVYPGTGHVCLPDMWRKTQAWFESRLR